MMMRRIRQISYVSALAFMGLVSSVHAAPLYHYTTVRWVIDTRDNLDMDDRVRYTGRAGNEAH